MLEVVRREPIGSVIGSTFSTWLRGGTPQTLYLPSLSLTSVVPSCRYQAHAGDAHLLRVLHMVVVAVDEDLAQHAGVGGEHAAAHAHAVLASLVATAAGQRR